MAFDTLANGAVKWGLVALIIFTPLAFGTVEQWSLALMEWGIATLAVLHVLGGLWGSGYSRRGRDGRTGLEVAALLFLGVCAVQIIPIPLGWLRVISPESARMYTPIAPPTFADGIQADAAQDLHDEPVLNPSMPGRRPISIRPGETRSRLLLVGSLAALFFLMAAWVDRGERAVFVIATVTTVGFLVALHGLVQFLTWNGRIYWIRKVPPSSPFGPFVNHNHFAGYVEMVIPVAIALTFYLVALRSRDRLARPSNDGAPWSPWGRSEGRWERWGQAGLALFAAVILIVSLIFSLSRGGILSTCVSGLILFAVIRRRVPSRLLAWSVAGSLLLVVALLVALIGADIIADKVRMSQDLPSEASFRSRLIVWDGVVRNLPGVLWMGAGLGTFEDSFAPHTPPGSSTRWDKAHNDYLQFLWETGLVGGLILLVCGVRFGRRYWWPALRSRDHPLDLLRVGVAVSLLSLALHSLVDFNLQIGANGFLCALLGGLLVGLDRVVRSEQVGRPVLVRDGTSPS